MSSFLVIPSLFIVTGLVSSEADITTSRFSTSNCNQWPVMEQDLSTLINLRSKLECASECAKMKCYCYKYLKQTSVCRLSSQGTSMETDGWLCLPVPSPGKKFFLLTEFSQINNNRNVWYCFPTPSQGKKRVNHLDFLLYTTIRKICVQVKITQT